MESETPEMSHFHYNFVMKYELKVRVESYKASDEVEFFLIFQKLELINRLITSHQGSIYLNEIKTLYFIILTEPSRITLLHLLTHKKVNFLVSLHHPR